MTSNLGSEIIRSAGRMGFEDDHKKVGVEESEMREHVLGVLNKNFRPEFLNRVDEIIFFHPLSRQGIEKIIDLQLTTIERRLADRQIRLKVKSAAKKLLAVKGFDQVFGARPLKRALQKEILDKLALLMIKGEIEKGETIEIDGKKDLIILQPLREKVLAKK